MRHIRLRCTEFKNDLVPEITSKIFCLSKQSQYNLRQQIDFRIPSVQSGYHGRKSIVNVRSEVWNLIPPDLQQLSCLLSFRKSNQKLDTEKKPVDFVKFT